MRYLIISDIHGNWEALEAVLAAARGRYDRILNCGDLVGYGADPNAVTAWCRKHNDVVIRGNHDKACAGFEDLDWFNPAARAAVEWTQQAMEPEHFTFVRELAAGPVAVDGFQIVHGSPQDEDEYLVDIPDVVGIAPLLEYGLSFFGHTHLQGGFAIRRQSIRRLPLDDLEIREDEFYLVNPGSVGQPRDGDPRAAYALYDNVERYIEYGRVEYDIAEAQRKIRDAGLPDLLAARLAIGR